MVKIIVMDLDGTLLNDKKNISEYNLSVLKDCRNNGIKIVIATARSEKSSKRITNLIKPDYMILNGGALVKRDNGEIIYEKLLSTETTDGIINECINNKNIGNLTVETKKNYYVTYKENAYHIDYAHGKYNDFTKPLLQESYKITCEINNIETGIEIVKHYKESTFLRFSGDGWGRFAHKEAEKILAIKTILTEEKIKIRDTIAFGDDFNDIEMVKASGIGIAMENGIDEIKNVAKYICKNNNEDGVGKWLEENILRK
jgi:Cof subfamily protein (haloacid dehalogenase superfamily)